MRELLAILWALDTLHHYLYGKNYIYMSTNSKIKRWKERVKERSVEVLYKPGKDNFVADALSHQNVHSLQDAPESDAATGHSQESLTYVIEYTDKSTASKTR